MVSHGSDMSQLRCESVTGPTRAVKGQVHLRVGYGLAKGNSGAPHSCWGIPQDEYPPDVNDLPPQEAFVSKDLALLCAIHMHWLYKMEFGTNMMSFREVGMKDA